MATYEMRLRVTSETDISIADNTSDVTVALDFRRTDYYYWGQSSDNSAYWQITADGQTYTEHFNFNWNIPQYEWKQLGSHTFTITHNSDGSKTLSMSGKWYSGNGVYPGTVTGSGTATLTTIPRASSFGTISGDTIGSQINISVNAATSSFTHKFWYRVGDSGWIESPLTFTPSLSLCSQVPNATSATMELRLRTMSGSTQIGSDVYKSITVYVPSSVVPSISAVNITEAVSGLNTQFGAYVQNKSKLRVKTTSAGAQGSTIKTVKVTAQDSDYYGPDITTAILTSSGNVPISVTVTDSRGRTATSSRNATIVSYYAIKIDLFTAKRCNANGTANEAGTALSIQSKYNIAPVGNRNAKKYKIEIQERGTTTWITLKNENAVNDPYSYNGTFTAAANTAAADKAYTLKLTVTDYFGSVMAFAEVGTVFRIININTSKKGIAFGKFSEKNAFECNMPAEFSGAVKLIGNTHFASMASTVAVLSGGQFYHRTLSEFAGDLGVPKPPVIETGTNYSAIKYPDGTMLLVQKVQFTAIIQTAWVEPLYEGGVTLGAWAVPFVSTPIIMSVINLSKDWAWWLEVAGEDCTATQIGTVYLTRPNSEVPFAATAGITAIGKWK